MFGKKTTCKMIKTATLQSDTVQFRLEQNSPNPFTGRTVFCLTVPKACEILLVVLDREAEKAAILYQGPIVEGRYSLEWDGRDNAGQRLKSGSYVYQLETRGFVASRRLMIANN
ncbi:MAG: hypothetical protein KDI38_15905 [Calditrichaeota bacterium]|nr:hypothetical protein [Calditrichota bacterium]MCB0305248.1 hypothetical protein [Calditrichota bacterium]